MEVFARDLKVVDKVNYHTREWLVVEAVRDGKMMHVTYNNGMIS